MANTFAGKIAEAQNRTSSLSGYAIPLSDEAVKQSEEDRKNAIIRSGATVLDVVTNVLQGVTSSLEGIYDFGQGIVGAVGGIVDKDFQDRVQKSIEYDFTSDLFGKDGAGNGKFDTTWGSDLAEQSYLKEDGIVNSIAQGFGGMLPSIAITLATGGAGAGSLVSTVGKIGASVAFGGGAAGKSMEQALKQGANYGQALGYGAVSGAIELGTEALGGVAVGGSTELANSVIGKWLIKTGADKAVRKGIGKVAYTFASEGVEEVLSDILDPINQKAWGIENDIDWGEVVSGLPKTFLVGGGLGVVMEGMGSSISALKNSDKGGTKYNSIVTDLTTIQDLTAADEAVKASSATQDKVNSVETKVNERILESVKSISETAKSMTEEQRAALFAEAPILENFIGKDGEINADLEASLTAQKESGVSANSSKAGFNTEAEKKRLAEWFGGEEVTLDIDAISETERDAMRQVVSAQKGINAKTGSNVRVVLVKTNDAAKKSFVNIRVGDTIYMTRENLSNGKWAAKLIHENEHLIEGVNEELAEALMSDESTLDEAKKSVISNYGVTSEEMDSAIKKAKTGLSMTERENLAYSELVAKLSEQMGTKESIARIARDNSTLAKKILNGIKDSISTLTASKADRATLASLRAKERLFEKALEKQNVARQVKLYNDDTKEEPKTEEREKVKRDLERAIAFNIETETEENREKVIEEAKKNGTEEQTDVALKALDLITGKWREESKRISSSVLEGWNTRKAVDRVYEMFPEQMGYKYNQELASQCAKGLPLFDAINAMVESDTFKKWGIGTDAKSKQTMYAVLRNNGLLIPCAICYVEEARRREGDIIKAFLLGNTKGKIGWESVLSDCEKFVSEKTGETFSFDKYGEEVFKDGYKVTESEMTKEQSDAIDEFLIPVINEEIKKQNAQRKKNFESGKAKEYNETPMLRYASDIPSALSGSLSANLKLLKTLAMGKNVAKHVSESTLMHSMAIRNIAMENPSFFSVFNSQGGVSGYKVRRQAEIYDHDALLRDFNDSRKEGGIRSFSNSDFEILHFVDWVQYFVDLTAKKQYSQNYTKVLADAKLFGLSNGKINMSLIGGFIVAKNASGIFDDYTTRAICGLDENGELIFDDLEGIDHKEAWMLLMDKEYSRSVGTVGIGYSVEQMWKMLDSDMVSFVIGFHAKSNDPKKRFYNARYATNFQKDHANEAVGKDGKRAKIDSFSTFLEKAENLIKSGGSYTIKNAVYAEKGKLYSFLYGNKQCSFYGHGAKTGETERTTSSWDDVPKIAAQMYLDECSEKGYRPAYEQFSGHPNYYKTLADFSLYDSEGHYAPHEAVEFRLPDSIPMLGKDGTVTRMDTFEYISNELRDYLAQRQKCADLLADNTIQSQIAAFVENPVYKGTALETAAFRIMNDADQSELDSVMSRAKQIQQEMNSDIRYSYIDSEGRTLSKEQQEFFKDSKVRDENGNLLVVYHGTPIGGFTVFNPNQSTVADNPSIASWFTTNTEMINQHYNVPRRGVESEHQLYTVYLNAKNPLVIDAKGDVWNQIKVSDVIRDGINYRYRHPITDEIYVADKVTTEQIAKYAKKNGYDGVIIYNVRDGSTKDAPSNVYAVFNSNQIKSIDNTNPTSDADIRYSMENPDEKVATRGEVAELQAKNSGDKFFTYENAKKAVRTFEGSIDGYVLPKRTFTQLSNMVHESLNLKTSGARLSRFKEIASLAIDMAKNQDGEAYGDSLTLPERNKAVSDIVDSLKSFYEEKGTKSDKVKADEKIKSVVDTADRRVDIIKEREKAKTEEAKRKVSEVEEQLKRLSSPYKSASLIHSISQTADELHAFTDRKYAQTHGIPVSVNLFKDDQFKSLAVAAQKVFTGKMLSPRKVREAVCNLSRYLNTETNEIFREFVDGLNAGNAELLQADFDLIDDSYDEKTQTYSTDPLSLQELQAVDNIFKTIKKMYTDYDSIVLDGKRVSLTESAKEYQAKMVESIEARAPLSDSAFKAFLGKLDALGDFYVDTFATPSVVSNRLDGYRDGFFTEEMKKLQAAQWQATDINYELSKPAQEFIKKNKRYSKRLANERIRVFGKNLLVGEAIDLYLQVTQDNGALTIFHENGGGFVFTGENGKVESKATRVGGNKYETVKTAVKLFQEEMDSLFTEQDKEFISIIKGIYKETGVYKKKRDISRLGYSNVVGGEYYTITRDKSRIKSNVGDARTQYDDLQAVNNLAINKRRSEKAKAIPLLLTNVYDKMLNVCRQTSVYYAFSEEISNFNRLYNKNIGEEAKGEFFTIRGYAHDIWDGTEKYFRKLLNDMQGVSTKSKGTLEKLLGKARSAYAQSALGFNIKVIAGQPVSYFTALAMLDADCLAKGMAMKSDKKQMDKYSVTARIRNIDDVVVKAESITDKVGDVGKALTKPINWSDRFTIGQLWNACQLQVAKSKGFSIGSDENLKAAGELLDEVNSATQPTYQATDRSAFQRSDNEIIKSFAMFTSVAVKQLSLFVGSIGKVSAYKQYVKFYGKRLAEMKANGMSGEKFAEAMKMSSDAKAELKAAKKQMAKSLTAILITNAMYAIMCQAVKFLYDKDDEEDNDGKNIAEQATEQFVNSSVSMFPIGKEIYNLIQGYDLEAMPLSTLNDVASSIIDMFGTGKDIIEGNADRTDVAKALRDQIFSISALVGLPTRNIYNTLYGLVKRVSPATAYNINSIFYAAKGDDIKTAKTDSEASAAAAVAMLDRGFDIGKEQADILAKLYRSGYSLPSSAPDYITVDEEKVTLTKKQKQTFEIEYSKAATEADAIIGKIVGESEEVQAKTLSIIYKYYKDSATYECGFDSTKLYMFGQAVGIGDLSFMIAKVAELTANKSNRKEIITRYVSSASLTAVQKKMVMGYFGYKNESGEGAVKAYIAKLDLTTDEKKKLLGYCGY